MIKRIVKMYFKENQVTDFQQAFDQVKSLILKMEGCDSLELIQDVNNKAIFFTISIWESEEALNAYRNSVLFKSTWTKVKAMFDQKAEAWSTTQIFKSADNGNHITEQL